MASTQTGIISTLSENSNFKDRGGNPVTLYSFQLQGSNKWYRTGSNPIPFAEGTGIKFILEGQNATDLQEVDAASLPAQPPAAAPRPRNTGGGKAGGENWEARQKYWEEKERRDVEVVQPNIQIQSARNAAISLVSIALEHEALPGFKTAAAAKKLDIIKAAVEEIQHEYLAQLVEG